MTKQDSTQRFSNRVQNYENYRPGYPIDLYKHLKNSCKLSLQSNIVEVGSGTGIFGKSFLEMGHALIGVEPNRAMRLAAEDYLSGFPLFTSLDGSAERIPIKRHSADLLLAAQAFHWFDLEEFRAETKRVLKSNGKVALIWNEWDPNLSPLLRGYDQLLRQFGTDYEQVRRRHNTTDQSIKTFFANSQFEITSFPNAQEFDFEGLRGRLLSSSYVPLENDSRYAPMLDKLALLFAEFQANGLVEFNYITRCYLGSITASKGENLNV